MYKKLLKDDNGFTGLEAAIVLIAFVVVAAVFSYVMLGAGFFTTQKSQEVVHTGVTQASSSVALAGDVIMTGGATAGVGEANQLTFYLTNTAGGTSVDLDKTIITYTDKDDFATQGHIMTGTPLAETGAWHYESVIPATKATSANLIEAGDKFKITLDLTATPFGAATNTKMDITTLPKANENIKIEVKPPEGAVLVITRIMPPSIGSGVYYPVY